MARGCSRPLDLRMGPMAVVAEETAESKILRDRRHLMEFFVPEFDTDFAATTSPDWSPILPRRIENGLKLVPLTPSLPLLEDVPAKMKRC